MQFIGRLTLNALKAVDHDYNVAINQKVEKKSLQILLEKILPINRFRQKRCLTCIDLKATLRIH